MQWDFPVRGYKSLNVTNDMWRDGLIFSASRGRYVGLYPGRMETGIANST